jgi:ppGpp synthetase/RelA/SpoT-type nucleotidyltranferase
MSSTNGDIDPTPGIVKRDTMLEQAPTPKVIEDFMKNYRMTVPYFESLAAEAHKLIIKAMAILFPEGFEAKVEYRAKTAKSLREKLRMRYEEKQYKVDEDIWRDIHDLAGVRIILYKPSKNQRMKARKILRSIWGNDVTKESPHPPARAESFEDSDEDNDFDDPEKNKLKRTKKTTYKRRHLGYQADHYRVDMKTIQKYDERSNPSERPDYERVEIQVVSALGHAWSEASHDVLYKSYTYGRPTIEEERIFDALNGIIISGDSLLEQLHELVMKRTYTRWTKLEEFSIFLRGLDVLQDQEKHNKIGKEGLDVLFRFLIITDQNYPLAVRNALKDKMGYPDHPRLDAIIATYKPMFEPVVGTLASICLINQMMPDGQVVPALEVPCAGAPECRIMISALTMLQNVIGGPEAANKFLRDHIKPEMTKAEVTSLEFVLTHSRRQLGLDEKHPNYQHNEDIIKPDLHSLWNWFQDQNKKPNSICGLFFQLAAMGATKVVDPITMLSQLSIGSLSRSSTTSMDEEVDYYSTEH